MNSYSVTILVKIICQYIKELSSIKDYIIKTENLSKKFDDFTAVDKVNLKVEKGAVHGLLGPNGAGKSTLISMLCTITHASSGNAYINDFSINSEATQVRESIGVVFQSRSLDDMLTGREHLEMHASLYGLDYKLRNKRISEILEIIQLEDKADELTKTYSGGMKRRLEIGRGLIHYPKVLFLDEPTLGLDPQTRENIWQYIEKLNKIEDVTVLITTHYLDEADKLCDKISLIDEGKIVKEDTPENLKQELKSDIIQVKTNDNIKAKELLSKLNYIKNAYIEEELLKLTVERGENLIPEVVNFANENDIIIKSIEVEHPKLEDVFIHYTGKSFKGGKGE